MLLDMSVSAMNSEVREISKGWFGGGLLDSLGEGSKIKLIDSMVICSSMV